MAKIDSVQFNSIQQAGIYLHRKQEQKFNNIINMVVLGAILTLGLFSIVLGVIVCL